ncbi:uncharacterized protein LOC130912042 [Corythoichthys intestinalis]|uniref:uncharacterized protein LOC130912042 n=1 Tax=Corythoichthys intestinalis TaxID=161448 RepID=UPI0025A5D187|nr:uncharacterized protein LOC130912042 [Corythoichthys intestinalis]
MQGRSRSTHFIPTGRQLPRTPPLPEVKKRLEFKNEDQERSIVPFHHFTEGGEGHPEPNIKLRISGTRAGDTDSLLTGMKGYRLTAGDLEFMKKMLVDKQIKQLQGELEVMKDAIQREQNALELTLVSSENVQTDLEKFPSSSELMELLKQVLEIVSPSFQALELDAMSLLAMVTEEDVEKALSEKKKAIGCMEKEISLRKNSTARVELENHLIDEQMVIQGLMRELSELQSELAQQDVRKNIKPDARSKTALHASRKPSSNDARPKTNLISFPSKARVEKAPKEAPGQQPLVCSKPPRGARGRPEVVRHTKSTVTQAESVKEADVSKTAQPARRRVQQQQRALEEPNNGPRRSKRIASRR